MSNNQSYLGLRLSANNGQVVLIFDYKITKFKDLKIEPSPNIVFNPAVGANITISFAEATATDDTDRPERIFSKKFAIVLGPYRQTGTSKPTMTLGEWVTACQDADHAHKKYPVIVEINGQDGRKTVTYISEDADIDLTKINEDYEMINSIQA